ncbi:MAG TPA: UDP-N-acetylmuramate--L-alanine ligase [Terriglobales bacterium]|jgi:UDP-N-acetylmuramate--alanine ligase|nr:UDP-N-acetylmuramate--L-alanine ligase [Terriglobales bacterium]
MFAKIQRVHFVGIGGIGMSGIAEVLLNLGYKISGSDLKRSSVTDRLKLLGTTIFEGHRAENVTGADVVVTSSAIDAANPEVHEAMRLHVPVIPRAEMLAELMRLKYGIAIAGMHGKTTTTSMVAAVLAAAGLDPTVVVGGRVDAMGSNARLGRSQYLVAEADESDRSFLKLSPILSVVTNIDREHMDCYRNMQDIKRAFLDFMDRVPFYGMLVLCNDDPILRRLLPRIRRRMIAYGTRPGSDFLITTNQGFARNSHRPDSAESGGRERPGLRRPQKPAEKAGLTAKPVRAPLTLNSFQVSYRGADLGEFCLHVPGMHNVLNATAAIAVGIGLDIPVSHIREALENFRGVDRRFQLRGEAGGVAVIDDYGHHPTEIKATLAAARQCGYRKIHVIFQPHRYTRTRDLMDEFTAAFGNADSLFVLDIYPASEQPIEGITAEALARKIAGTSSRYVASFEEAVGAAATAAQPGDMILTLGAGSVSQLGPMLLEKLQPSASGSGRKQPGMEVAYRPDDHQG